MLIGNLMRNDPAAGTGAGPGITRRGFVRSLLMTSGSLGLAGCSGLGEAPRATFDLGSPDDLPSSLGRTGAQILIPHPSSVEILDSNRIVVRESSSELAYLPGVQWVDTVPKLVQARVRDAFENSGKVRAVGVPGEGLLIDYQVALNIRAFEIRSLEGDVAHVDVSARILDDRNGRVRSSRRFEQKVASGPSVDDNVDALNEALDRVITEILVWTLRTV